MKKEYKKPKTEVINIQQVQMLCASTTPPQANGTPEEYWEME